MLTTLLDRVGDWNPQLFREAKGRLQKRNVYMIAAGSITSQAFIYQVYQDYTYNILNNILPFLLIIGGVYLLSKDIAEEEQRGTLNFIRLSPQNSETILWGKILGVPALVYLGIGLALPLHFLMGLTYHVSFWVLIGNYIFWGASCYLFYNLALGYSLLISFSQENKYSAGTIAGAVILIASFITAPYLQLIQEIGKAENSLDWFFIPIGQSKFLGYFWLLMSIGIASRFIWIAINRRFGNPNSTLINKGQSYQLMTSLQLWMLGFFLSHDLANYGYEGALVWLLGFSPFIFLFLIMILSPSHQSLLDWARYRHQIVPQKDRSLWRDLIIGEKSPPILAIAVNILITAVLWGIWLFLLPESVFSDLNLWRSQVILALVLTLGIMLIYGTIFQIILLKKTPKAGIWATGTLTALAILPLASGGILALNQIHVAVLWIVSPLPLFFFVNGSNLTATLGLFFQIGILTELIKCLQRQIRQAGAIES